MYACMPLTGCVVRCLTFPDMDVPYCTVQYHTGVGTLHGVPWNSTYAYTYHVGKGA